ncbi:MAG: hypothetical protein KF774_08405 [Planctomyces sp.]|nr:hypothetical protein [Planctomyces sp.]
MVVRRVFAVLFCSVGSLSLAVALESSVGAVSCVPAPYIMPAECEPAHASPEPDSFHIGPQSGCDYGVYDCVPQTGCSSTPHWASAQRGACQMVLGGSQYFACQEDSHVKRLVIYRVIGECSLRDEGCGCGSVAEHPDAWQEVEVCDCHQTVY